MRSYRGNELAPDGYRYGVRFRDGSVAARWSGRTQARRAADEFARLRVEYPRDAPTFAIVRRSSPLEPWESVTHITV